MKYFLMALTVVVLGIGMGIGIYANAVCSPTEVKGTWTYATAGTGEINKIVFKIVGGGKVDARIFEKCNPNDCDRGWHNCSVRFSDCTLTSGYTNDISERNLTMNMINVSTLQVKVHTRFTDNSGRPETDKTYTFRRLVVQKPQTPKPMDRTTPKPMGKTYPKPSTSSGPTGKY